MSLGETRGGVGPPATAQDVQDGMKMGKTTAVSNDVVVCSYAEGEMVHAKTSNLA